MYLLVHDQWYCSKTTQPKNKNNALLHTFLPPPPARFCGRPWYQPNSSSHGTSGKNMRCFGINGVSWFPQKVGSVAFFIIQLARTRSGMFQRYFCCQLGDLSSPIPPIKGTRNSYWRKGISYPIPSSLSSFDNKCGTFTIPYLQGTPIFTRTSTIHLCHSCTHSIH